MGGGRALECRVDGRRFLLYVPASAAEPAPLLLALHGVGGPAATPEATLEASRLDAAAEEHGFVLALPAGEDGTWDDEPGSPDVAFAGAVIDAAGEEHPLDPDRVYVTGWSGGGFMAHRLACDAADRVAAVAVLHAPLRGPCEPARPPDVLQLAGEADDVLPDAGGTTPDGTVLPPLRRAMRRWEESAAGWSSWRCPTARARGGPRRPTGSTRTPGSGPSWSPRGGEIPQSA